MADNSSAVAAKDETKVESPASPTPGSKSTSPAPASPVAADAAAGGPAAVTPAAAEAEAPATATGTTPPSTGAPDAQAAPAAPAAPHPNPKVAALHGMFPTVDTGVIEMVLESVGGSQDRAIECLLQMTDPEFKPDNSTAQTEENTSQLNMDEEFARALHIQEQEEMRAPPPRRLTNENAIPAVLPYQPRIRRPRPAQPDPYASTSREHDLADRYAEPRAGHGPGGDAPGMIAFEEKLGQFAEAGKQTFNRFWGQAKARIDQMQEQHQDRRQEQMDMANEWREQGHPQAQGAIVGAHERKQYGGLWGAMNNTQPVASAGGPGASPVASPKRWSPSDAYEDARPMASSPGRARSPIPGSGSASPDKVPTGKIDLSKLGFLPKKKVDLMSTGADKDPNPQIKSPPKTPPTKSALDQIPKTPPAELSPHTLGDSDDDDDLDYTQNPFDRK